MPQGKKVNVSFLLVDLGDIRITNNLCQVQPNAKTFSAFSHRPTALVPVALR